MSSQQIVSFSSATGLLSLVGATIVVDGADYPGIFIAAHNLAEDFVRVTNGVPCPVDIVPAGSAHPGKAVERGSVIIIGSLDRNAIISRLSQDGKLDTSNIRGRWESFTTAVVEAPFPGCRESPCHRRERQREGHLRAYTLSEQIGVSP